MARRGWLALMPILLWALSGCNWTEHVEPSAWMRRFQSQAISPDHALIEVALIERPLGDDYINQSVWLHTDELIIDLERRGALDDNGLRVGQLVGSPPNDFQQLLLDKRCCHNPQAMIFPTTKTVPIHISGVLPQSSYEVVQGQSRTEVTSDQARYGLSMSAKFASDGRTILTFTPKVEHGEPTLPFQADAERSAWELRIEKACRKHPELSWEVTLGPNQYLLVGGRPERDRTLGQAAFTHVEGLTGVQRLLVIRNCRAVTASEARDTSTAELIRADSSMPLALQATLPASRAKSN